MSPEFSLEVKAGVGRLLLATTLLLASTLDFGLVNFFLSQHIDLMRAGEALDGPRLETAETVSWYPLRGR